MNKSSSPEPLSPLDLVQAMQDRTNQLIKAFQEMSKMEQAKVIGGGTDDNLALTIRALDEILTAEKSKQVLHPRIWGEINLTAQALRQRQSNIIAMTNVVKNKRRF